ncbi:MAG: beta-galactosidase [Clostridia bacterium]|nr:beta-galactosidase [Clostridia bacterium]
MNKIYLGANYYPEDWDESCIDEDIVKMKECGFNVVRIGEFAWKKDEPAEGQFDFAWLHRVVDKMREAGIAVIMGTPTATPPSWLYQKYPDMATLSPSGVRTSHGGRRHCCSCHPAYLRYSAIIVKKIAEEFGSDPAIIGWQIDNEIYPWEPGCTCQHCQDAFHAHLAEKYGSVEEINRAWNLNLFSQAYDRIEDIPVPVNTWHNPHIILEWNLSQAKNHVRFVHMQSDILKKYTSAPIGTDTMPVNGIDYRTLNDPMDVAQFNHYNTRENLLDAARWMDYMKHFSKIPFWNTETQPCWNGSTAPGNALQPEGYIYMNTWLPIMLGGGANLYWLWRTHWAGHELMHGAVLDTSGRYTYANGEIRHAAEDFQKLEDLLLSAPPASDTAIHFSSLNWCIRKSQAINGWVGDNGAIIQEFYEKLLRSGIHADVIDAAEEMDRYKLIFSPTAYTLEEADFRRRITQWVEDGGVWVVGPLSDIRTAIGTKYKASPYGFLEELLGARLSYLLPDDQGQLRLQNELGDTVRAGRSYELFDDGDFEKLLSITDGHSALIGKHCAIARKIGKGKVILLGTFPEDGEFARIALQAANFAGAEVFSTTDGAMITKRAGGGREFVIAAAVCGKACEYRFEGKRVDLLTDKIYDSSIALAPYQIAVLEALPQ